MPVTDLFLENVRISREDWEFYASIKTRKTTLPQLQIDPSGRRYIPFTKEEEKKRSRYDAIRLKLKDFSNGYEFYKSTTCCGCYELSSISQADVAFKTASALFQADAVVYYGVEEDKLKLVADLGFQEVARWYGNYGNLIRMMVLTV